MSIESRELVLFITNDGELYRQQITPICENLAKKMRKNIFDSEKAKVLFGYLAEAGAKKYHKQFGSKDQPWHKMFTTATRKECAAELLEYYTEGIQELAQ